MKPKGTEDLSSAEVKTLMAVVAIHETEGRVTTRAVADKANKSLSTIHVHLVKLRKYGLVTWEPKMNGTLRPLVKTVRG